MGTVWVSADGPKRVLCPRRRTCLRGTVQRFCSSLTCNWDWTSEQVVTDNECQVRRGIATPNPVDQEGFTGFVSRADLEISEAHAPGPCLTWISQPSPRKGTSNGSQTRVSECRSPTKGTRAPGRRVEPGLGQGRWKTGAGAPPSPRREGALTHGTESEGGRAGSREPG